MKMVGGAVSAKPGATGETFVFTIVIIQVAMVISFNICYF